MADLKRLNRYGGPVARTESEHRRRSPISHRVVQSAESPWSDGSTSMMTRSSKAELEILGDLALTEGIVERAVDHARLDARSARLGTIDRQRQRGAIRLLVRSNV